jgi:hypothetical protein
MTATNGNLPTSVAQYNTSGDAIFIYNLRVAAEDAHILDLFGGGREGAFSPRQKRQIKGPKLE